MDECLKSSGTEFTKALAAFGTWAAGIASKNANVRSDMYKQLLAQLRSTSSNFRAVAESVLQAKIAEMWDQLVEDYAIQKLEATDDDKILYLLDFDCGGADC
jgi:hypothetical protein